MCRSPSRIEQRAKIWLRGHKDRRQVALDGIANNAGDDPPIVDAGLVAAVVFGIVDGHRHCIDQGSGHPVRTLLETLPGKHPSSLRLCLSR